LALYTASLLELASHWERHNLTLYIDDSAIYTTSATTTAATTTAIDGFETTLDWLWNNSLLADSAKTELMVFSNSWQPNLTGGKIWGAQYNDAAKHHNITTVTSLCYLRVFITANLKWNKHISIMVNRACSTICRISILGNSIQGLDFLNWCHVYNVLIVPVLTYGAQVWYIGVN